MPGNPIKISGYDDPPERVGAPQLNQRGEALRREFGWAEQAKDAKVAIPANEHFGPETLDCAQSIRSNQMDDVINV